MNVSAPFIRLFRHILGHVWQRGMAVILANGQPENWPAVPTNAGQRSVTSLALNQDGPGGAVHAVIRGLTPPERG